MNKKVWTYCYYLLDRVMRLGLIEKNKKTRLHHRHLIFERGSYRDCAAKIRQIFYIKII
ncbi:MAG: hypothetical protein LBG80_03770 [Bacteroidales bacterium]|nr:hypothetical protein [Bacteroidales bacterium]